MGIGYCRKHAGLGLFNRGGNLEGLLSAKNPMLTVLVGRAVSTKMVVATTSTVPLSPVQGFVNVVVSGTSLPQTRRRRGSAATRSLPPWRIVGWEFTSG
jgi:hypothetical protein